MSVKNSILGLWVAVKALWNPKARRDLTQYVFEMMKEGVNPLEKEERRAWIRSHRREVRTAIGLIKPKIGRNAPCSCGSGKKYKKCCGKGQA